MTLITVPTKGVEEQTCNVNMMQCIYAEVVYRQMKDNGNQTVWRHILLSVLTTFEEMGGNADDLLAQFDIEPNQLMTPNFRVKSEVLASILLQCKAVTRQSSFGVLAGQRPPLTNSPLAISWLASGTALKGLERLCRYASLIESGIILSMARQANTCTLRVRDWGSTWQPIMEDILVSRLCFMAQKTLPKNTPPLCIKLRQKKPASPDPWHNLLGPVIHWEADEIQITWDDTILSQPRFMADEATAQLNEAMVKKQLYKLAHPTLAKKVESKILMQINTVVPDAELISRDLGMASRTLQRRLKEEGTSFKDILKEVRKTQAIDRVLTNSESIESIASSLGYSDQRAFSKAFKNWVGHSPTSYRSRFKRS